MQAILPRVRRRVITYGATVAAAYRTENVTAHEDFTVSFDIFEHDFLLGRARLRLPGRHNALNALAAVAVGRELGLEAKTIIDALEQIDGVARRFEVKGEEDGVLVVDDYGHHPKEVAAVLRAAREHSQRRVVVVFQPHRYTRTRDLLDEFAGAFNDADQVFIAPIYAAGEDPLPGVEAANIVKVVQAQGHTACTALDDYDTIAAHVRPELRSGDLVLTLGAGNIVHTGEVLLRELAAHGAGARS